MTEEEGMVAIKQIVCLLIVVSFIPACSPATKTSNLPNPASVYCVKHGGKLKLIKDKHGNNVGYCHFSDGEVCEEWAFFRHQCGKQK